MYVFFLISSILAATNAIEGGKDASIRDFPYQAAVELWIGSQVHFLCNGAIISKNWILTSSLYFTTGPSRLKIRAGTDSTGHGGSLHQVDKIILQDDLALVRVDPAFVFDESRQPIGLFESTDVLTAGTKANVFAFGEYIDTSTQSYQPKRLQYMEVYVEDDLKVGFGDFRMKFEPRDEGDPVVVNGKLAGIARPWSGNSYNKAPIVGVASCRDWIDRELHL